MSDLRVLAVAAATGRVGYMFLDCGIPRDWKYSKTAFRSPKDARKHAEAWIAYYNPDVMITERITKHSRKGARTRRIIATIASVAANGAPNDIVVPRVQAHKNKYAEARALAKRFPELRPRLPRKPRCWQSEPFGTICFEALSLALQVIDDHVGEK